MLQGILLATKWPKLRNPVTERRCAKTMKLIIPIAGTLAVCACTVWVFVTHTVRRKSVIYQPSEHQNKTKHP